MTKPPLKPLLLNLSVEEENLAAIPFAVLERRVGKHLAKIEIKGNKILPDGSRLDVVWQVQGNNELGLPTEQDLDLFVALGVLTFRNNFSKTVSFTGREIARILNIGSVNGRFYQRLKMAMDRFIPLRFRALTATDQQEQVKWVNVFQEASFTLDRQTGRCTGAITWTDKLIQSMDSGFFRALDAGRYMALDGITAKHLYRFLAVAFEKTDTVVIDARKLATQHIGILTPPKYLSRLMQTLEPALDQLVRIGVLGGYHIVSTEEWRIALRRHAGYVPERKALLEQAGIRSPELNREYCRKLLENGGLAPKTAGAYADMAQELTQFYALERAAHLLQAMKDEEVMPQVAVGFISRAIEAGAATGEGRNLLDWCEIALDVCRQKKRSGQTLKNSAGLLVKILKSPETRRRVVSEHLEAAAKERFRQRENTFLRQREEDEERTLILEYEQFSRDRAAHILDELPEANRQALRKEKAELLARESRMERMTHETREREIHEMILQDLRRKDVPPYQKWLLRKRAMQATLPFPHPGEAARAE